MTISQAIILGIVQGITEFFPISSSGHLVIMQNIFGLKSEMLTFDIFLHLGTLISVILFFRKDIINMLKGDRTLLKLIVIASIPTFIIGILFKDAVETLFSAPQAVGYFLLGTGVFLMIASFFAIYRKIARKEKPLTAANSVIIGIAQGVAVIPGISRSGATIGTALIAGLNEVEALKFSFLLSIPAVLGANILKVRHIYGNLISLDSAVFIAGGIAAFVSGLLAIKILFTILKKNLFFLFAIYCILIGAAVIIRSN